MVFLSLIRKAELARVVEVIGSLSKDDDDAEHKA